MFCVYYITRGVLQENRQELIIFVVCVLVVMVRSVVNFSVHKEKETLLTVHQHQQTTITFFPGCSYLACCRSNAQIHDIAQKEVCCLRTNHSMWLHTQLQHRRLRAL